MTRLKKKDLPPKVRRLTGSVDIPEGVGEKFENLARIMEKLRSPDGCPWDLEQTQEKLARHLLEEAYETIEAIDSGEWKHVGEELGDLLLQIVFQSRIAQECGRFDLGEVVDGIASKLERRHPHIFGDVKIDTAEQVSVNWERIKREQEGKQTGINAPPGLPAMLAAVKVQNHAAREGFDWINIDGILSKIDEEIEELREARDKGATEAIERETGDLLFTIVNLARRLDVDPEQALRRSVREFVRRYACMEKEADKLGLELAGMSLDEKDQLWRVAKTQKGV
ncbi:MAG: nucleoside triphosphate pyrophosphohydrolase [Candidatus Anoxymicrobium japonicum]|uniref:Nucleoside triphosphate pyrophosphohydrolase n=1 Tax=Candidatus Anoxymicrobium japonicum TaxID=2013648 RepID=A0A2N3G5Z5_9ACTN|nr:MAG: nucleoside triphosphate pyrophosphohydrolase [Candidatus Anoxymicrobium japonicum]